MTKTIEYAYDVFDRRVEKAVTPVSSPAGTEQFVYDGAHVARRFENASLSNRYLHGPAMDQILADEQVSAPTVPGEVLGPMTDNLRTVRDGSTLSWTTTRFTAINAQSWSCFCRNSRITVPRGDDSARGNSVRE